MQFVFVPLPLQTHRRGRQLMESAAAQAAKKTIRPAGHPSRRARMGGDP
jgi:hypothetical protein